MQTLIGRLTADAQVKQTANGREVVSFSLALNRRYKAKDSDEVTEMTTYVNCSYWRTTAIAPYLKKGNVIATTGHIALDTWTNTDGEAKAAITQHVQNIDLYTTKQSPANAPKQGKGNKGSRKNGKPAPAATEAAVDDLPF